MSIIQGTSKAAGGGYTIDQSVRFERADNSYMSWTPGGAPTSRRIYTFSWWVKRTQLGVAGAFGHYLVGTAGFGFFMNIDPDHKLAIYTTGGTLYTNAMFRDLSAWYHIVLAIDTTQATASDRVRLYVNEVEQTFTGSAYPAQNSDQNLGQSVTQYLGFSSTNQPFDGYMAEVIVVDGQQLTPSDFGEYNSNGVWVPKAYEGSFGTNGFYLDFADSSSLGTDVSGNGNNLTPSGITSDDQFTDSPTDNFCTLNAVHNATGASYLSEGNLHFDPNANWRRVPGTFLIPATGKWAFKVTSNDTASATVRIGVADASVVTPTNWTTTATSTLNISGCYVYADNGTFGENGGGATAYGAAYQSAGDYVEVLVDSDSNTLTFTKNGSSQGTATSSLPNGVLVPLIEAYGDTLTCDFGQGGYTPSDSSYKTLSTANLPTPAIADGSAYFQTTLYTGNGTAIGSGGNAVSQIENSTFQPDFVWIKRRNAVVEHVLTDAVRGVTEELNSNDNTLEETVAEGLTSFDSSGFTVGSNGSYNTNTGTYVAWQWLAGNGTASNTDGDITSTVSANTTSGVAVLTYSGNNSDNQTIGHGLGIAPKMIITKRRDTTGNWIPYHDAVGINKTFYLNSTAIPATNIVDAYRAVPTSSVYTIGTGNNINASGGTYVAYVFAEVDGFSKFGSYTGNGNANGPFVWCGFRPAFMLIKNITVASSWEIFDSERPGYNETDLGLYPDGTYAEATGRDMDLLSNGFKVRTVNTITNNSGATHIFMAFAEHPFGGVGVAPVPAR